ncbi:MAG: alpha/beta hydrolase [Erysipelotrichaceae bacterium]|nr:alpha/beta hydrolase [Erysipelotrichaceae bacterium]
MMFVIVVVVILALLFIADYAVTKRIFEYIFAKTEETFFSKGISDIYSQYQAQAQKADEWLAQYEQESLKITSKDGLNLEGTLVRMVSDTNKVILAIGDHQSVGMQDMGRFAEMYQELGYDACIIDSRACGNSQGQYGSFGYYEQDDVLLWCQKLIEIYGETVEIVLHGMGVGAATVCLVSGQKDLPKQITGGVADGAYQDITVQLRHLLNTQTQLPVEFTLMMLNLICKQKLHFDFKKLSAEKALQKCQIPMLFIHGEKDSYTPSYMSEHLYDACATKNKQIEIVNEAKHNGCYLMHPIAYQRYIQNWLESIA